MILDKLLPPLEGRAEILAVYLFGSVARTAVAPRDLDLAVILREGFVPDRFYEFTLAEELMDTPKTDADAGWTMILEPRRPWLDLQADGPRPGPVQHALQ